jgi:REP element-mobilizing transposase RayT
MLRGRCDWWGSRSIAPCGRFIDPKTLPNEKILILSHVEQGKTIFFIREVFMPWNKPYRKPCNQRLDPELYIISNKIYFMTVRAYKNTSPFIKPDLNELLLSILQEEQARNNCTIYTYCLMPNHFHFLVSPNIDGVSVLTFTDQFKGKTTNKSWDVGWKGKLWQARYYDHIVRTDESLHDIGEYILNNPVRKEFVENPEDWLWSGHMNELPW